MTLVAYADCGCVCETLASGRDDDEPDALVRFRIVRPCSRHQRLAVSTFAVFRREWPVDMSFLDIEDLRFRRETPWL